jgi:hypothetical protein
MTTPAPEPSNQFSIVNADEARFECIFGRGCDGICCRNGRPPVYPDESERIGANLKKILPALRPEARRIIEKEGFLSRRHKAGQPMLRVLDRWCIFFNRGCVLHKIGAAEGDKFRYKPAVCALFPLTKDQDDRWYVRQKGFKGEIWDLFCLDPQSTTVRAVDSSREEIALAERFSREESKSRDSAPVESAEGSAQI